MRQSHTVANKLPSIFTAVFFFFLTLSLMLGENKAKADDREDAKALVGTWQCTASPFGLDNGKYTYFGGDGSFSNGNAGKKTWTVKNGKIVISELFSKDASSDFTLSPDGDTLKWSTETFKRKK